MTIEGAIADLQNLIDNEDIPFWAKPSLRKIKETVEMERSQYIKALKGRAKRKKGTSLQDLSLRPIKVVKNGNKGYGYYET